mgnify:CR=1 FL=1
MTDSTYPNMSGAVDNTSAATFIPEIWSDEVVAAYKSNLVAANLVKSLGMTGKKGDVVHIPKPVRGDAHAKAEGTAVTIQNATEGEVQVAIDKHFEYSRMIEDITETQALASLRQFYTGDAGYALAKQVDSDLLDLGKSLGNGDGSSWVNTGSYYRSEEHTSELQSRLHLVCRLQLEKKNNNNTNNDKTNNNGNNNVRHRTDHDERDYTIVRIVATNHSLRLYMLIHPRRVWSSRRRTRTQSVLH